ncbi:hypothetical protein HDU79_007355 [Rhizoclosmatium sp. JEL0117]|nr:hypothetical protein HDU79_007355 [Rhizoclosmatium sp. JEL0117]
MGGYTMGLGAKAPGLLKNRLASDLVQPMAKFGDPDFVDASTQHRNEMKALLYGPSRINKPTQRTQSEVGAHSADYADEKPPAWESTFTCDYTPKQYDHKEDDRKVKECTQYIKSAHFSLNGYGAEHNPTPISTTKRDFPGKYGKPLRHGPPRKTYPPIYRDEQEIAIGRSIYDSTFVPRVTHPAVIAHPDSSGTHFTLGDDTNTYKSITKSTFAGFGDNQPFVEIKKDEKKRSTVLDMPDGEKGADCSVQRADYTMDPKLDRKTLTVDNSMTVKDLRSTHFTLGNDDTIYKTSQYQSTFQRPPSNYVNDNLTNKVNHHQTYVTMKDEDDLDSQRVDKLSTQHRDYQKVTQGHDSKDFASQMKFSQTSSIDFGAHPFSSSKSITKSDFPIPPQSAYPAHQHTGITNPYNTVSGSRNPHSFSGGSVMKSSYIHFCDEGTIVPDDGSAPQSSTQVRGNYFESFTQSLAHKKNLRGHHFSLGSDEGGVVGETIMKGAYKDPGNDEYRKYKKATAGPEWRFGSTLHNTVTRYPKDPSTFQTVSDVTYVPHDNFVPPKPFKPAAKDFLFISAEDSEARYYNPPRLGGIQLSTETKRKFVPPEVMTYQQRMDLGKVVS